MQQRRKQSPGGRSIVHKVRTTQAEEDLLQIKANALGVTVSRLLAESALGKNDAMSRKLLSTELVGIRRVGDLTYAHLVQEGVTDQVLMEIKATNAKVNIALEALDQ